MTPPSDRCDAVPRGQANLAALAVALIAITTVAGLGLVLADGALAGADRTPLQRHAADTAADRLVAADAPTTRRANVLNRTAFDALTPSRLNRIAPAVSGNAVRVRLADRTVLRRGDPSGGVTVRRLVLAADETDETRRLRLSESDSVTLPRRTDRVRLDVRPASNTTVTTVRVDDRVVLHDPGGLSGTATVDATWYETLTLAVETRDANPNGTVAITYYPTQTTKAVLEVTVDA